VKFLAPKRVVPIHYDTWDLIHQDAEAFAQRVEKETKTKARVLRPGESIEV